MIMMTLCSAHHHQHDHEDILQIPHRHHHDHDDILQCCGGEAIVSGKQEQQEQGKGQGGRPGRGQVERLQQKVNTS